MTDSAAPSPILTLLGFLAVAGSFGTGIAWSYQHAAPEIVVQETEPPPPEDLMKVYYPFPEQIYVTMPDATMVILKLSFYLEAPPALLLHLQEEAKKRQPELMAALLAEAQLASEETSDMRSFRDSLPARMKAKVNGMLGSEEEPEPIREVLLTQFLSR